MRLRHDQYHFNHNTLCVLDYIVSELIEELGSILKAHLLDPFDLCAVQEGLDPELGRELLGVNPGDSSCFCTVYIIEQGER